MRLDQLDRCKSPGRLWSRPALLSKRVIDIDSCYIGHASRCQLGVCLTVHHRWSGVLIRQALYTFEQLNHLTPESRKETFMSFFRKPNEVVNGSGSPSAEDMPRCLQERAPALGAYLTCDTWPDGKPRSHSTLIIFVQDGMFKACLSDKDTNMGLWSSAKSFDDLLEALEARLTDDRPDWRKSKPKRK